MTRPSPAVRAARGILAPLAQFLDAGATCEGLAPILGRWVLAPVGALPYPRAAWLGEGQGVLGLPYVRVAVCG
jgi:hypothetical protein